LKRRIEVIAIDIDNTLIDHSGDSEIPAETIRAVGEAAAFGAHIVLASGRGYQGTTRFAAALGIRDYTIASVGAHVMDPDGELAFAKHIEPETTAAVLKYAAERGLYFQVYLDDGFYYLEQTEYSVLYEGVLGYAGKADPLLLSRRLPAAKLLLVGKPDEMAAVRAEMEGLFDGLVFGSSAPLFIEATSRDADKGRALAFVAERLGVPRERILAIGDSDIDISMLRYAGVGAAVARADSAVKAAADYICKEQNGVAEAIRKFAL
jgi:Cof subfamily protein (haloacid dehalogenase superfamily)